MGCGVVVVVGGGGGGVQVRHPLLRSLIYISLSHPCQGKLVTVRYWVSLGYIYFGILVVLAAASFH